VSDLGLDIAASGLDAQQALLDTAAQNLSNISTPGYARERVNLTTMPTEADTGVGQGVLVGSVTATTSSLYEALAVQAAGQLGAANEAATVQNAAQQAFPEPSANGLSSQLDQLFADLSTLATEPSSSAAATAVIGSAQQVAGTLNTTFQQLTSTQTQLVADLQGVGGGQGLVGQANTLITEVAQLNTGIVAGLGSGQPPNALIDQRRQALNQLAGLLGVTTTAQSDGSTTVSLNGIELVSGTTAVTLQAAGGGGGMPVTVQTQSGITVSPGGQIGSLLTGVNATIPSYQSGLSSVADALASAFNALQSGGVSSAGIPGPTAPAAAGWLGALLPADLFVNGGSTTTYTPGAGSAGSIEVNPTIVADPSLLATAAGTSTAGQPTIDATTAQQMAAIAQQANGPLQIYQGLVGLVGSQTAQAKSFQTTAQSLSDAATSQLSSVEGVDSNEETVNVLAAQQAYQSTASLINSINQSFQSLLQAV
jgi:flagellar hook-associated protein 1 FlgK